MQNVIKLSVSCVLVYAFVYLPHFIFLSHHMDSFRKGNEEQLGYIECRLSLEVYLFLIF